MSGRQPTYYFSAAGSDANDGKTLATPKQTLTAFNALTLVATDYVVFRQGDTFSGTMTIPGGGSVLSNIIIGSYGIGANPIIAAAANTNGIVATNLSYLTIQNFTITGSGTVSAADGIQIVGNASAVTNNITIQNCSASGFSHCGIYVNYLTGGATLANLSISGCTMSGNALGAFNGGAGIFVRGPASAQVSTFYNFSNVTISNCVAQNNTGANGTTSWCGSGIMMSEVNVGTITGCVASGNGGLCNAASGAGGIWTADSKFVTIQFCESYNNSTANNDGCGFDLDGGCDDCIIQYCYSHGNMGGGFMCFTYSDPTNISGNHRCIIRFNVSMRDGQQSTTGQGGINVVNATSSVVSQLQIYGNTIYTSSASNNCACVVINNVASTTMSGTIANNVFVTNGSNAAVVLTAGAGTAGGTMAVTGNAYFSYGTFRIGWGGTNYGTFAAWQTATGLEKIAGTNVAVSTDPKLVNVSYSGTNALSSQSQKNSFKLQSGSPCLGAGVNLQSQYSIAAGGRDYYGNTVTDGGTYDIGCAFSAAVLGSTVTSAFTDHAEDNTSQTIYTWTAKAFAIGTADATRLVVAAVTARIGANTTATCTGVTIGGVAAKLVTDGRNTGSSNLLTQSLWQAAVPTGTTATISAVFSVAMARAAVAVFSVTGSNGDVPLSTNAAGIASTDTATADPSLTTTISVPAQGASVVCGSCAGLTSGSPSITPTNYTTDLAPTLINANGTSHTAGHDATSGLRAYTQAWGGTGTNTPTGAFAAWMPTIT